LQLLFYLFHFLNLLFNKACLSSSTSNSPDLFLYFFFFVRLLSKNNTYIYKCINIYINIYFFLLTMIKIYFNEPVNCNEPFPILIIGIWWGWVVRLLLIWSVLLIILWWWLLHILWSILRTILRTVWILWITLTLWWVTLSLWWITLSLWRVTLSLSLTLWSISFFFFFLKNIIFFFFFFK